MSDLHLLVFSILLCGGDAFAVLAAFAVKAAPKDNVAAADVAFAEHVAHAHYSPYAVPTTHAWTPIHRASNAEARIDSDTSNESAIVPLPACDVAWVPGVEEYDMLWTTRDDGGIQIGGLGDLNIGAQRGIFTFSYLICFS
jgi:hypothetical protein